LPGKAPKTPTRPLARKERVERRKERRGRGEKKRGERDGALEEG
jgi:hypothetical protein